MAKKKAAKAVRRTTKLRDLSLKSSHAKAAGKDADAIGLGSVLGRTGSGRGGYGTGVYRPSGLAETTMGQGAGLLLPAVQKVRG
jgi:hypothetical protein